LIPPNPQKEAPIKIAADEFPGAAEQSADAPRKRSTPSAHRTFAFARPTNPADKHAFAADESADASGHSADAPTLARLHPHLPTLAISTQQPTHLLQ
jgi:hypothetical protein